MGPGVFILYPLWGAGQGHVDTVWGAGTGARGGGCVVGHGRFLGGFGCSKNRRAVMCSKNRYLGGSPIIIIIGLPPDSSTREGTEAGAGAQRNHVGTVHHQHRL